MTPEFEKTTAIMALTIQDVMVARLQFHANDRASVQAEAIATIRKRLLLHMRKLGVTGRSNLPLSMRQHVSRVLDITRPGWGPRHSTGEVLHFINQACENALAHRGSWGVVTSAQKRTWEEQIAGRQRLLEIALAAEK